MFTIDTLEFIKNNYEINDREWFNEHKDEYKKFVFDPLCELALSLCDTLNDIDEMIISEPRVDKTISRIYRDMRRVRDGYLFKNHVWLSFKRDRAEFPSYPEFYVLISPYEFMFGCGYYSAPRDTMDSLRKLIINDDKAYIDAQKAYDSQGILIMGGDKYRKSRYPEQAEKKRDWLERKNIYFSHITDDVSEVYSDTLPSLINNAFSAVKPIYNLFIRAEEIAAESRIIGLR